MLTMLCLDRMPQEHISLLFRPTHFFEQSPCMDLPLADDKCSVPAFPNGANGPNSTGTNGAGESCCH